MRRSTAIQGKFLVPRYGARRGGLRAADRVHVIPAHALNLDDAGVPIPTPILARLEAYFGESLADVRIHEGRQAEALDAVAFAMGNHIFFAKGRYQPFTSRG